MKKEDKKNYKKEFSKKTREQGENEYNDIVEGRNAVIELLNSERDINKIFVQNGEKHGSINKIIAIAEEYPELKASEQFLNLQKNLSKLESQLQAARRIYNNEVTDYNTLINTVPTNILAKIFNFKEADLFTIEEYKKENIDIELG